MSVATEVKYQVECQDEASHTTHEATFSHVNQYDQRIYIVVCDGYEERYTEEVVVSVKVPVADLGLTF